MPKYSVQGKLEAPLSSVDFKKIMQRGHFVTQKHRGYVSLLYYTGTRCSEALRTVSDQFSIEPKEIYWDVLTRLKHGRLTPSLLIPRNAYGTNYIVDAIKNTSTKKRVFPFCRKTAYNVCRRLGYYPHYFRLSRITNLLSQGWTIPQVRSWTGLTLRSLEHYVGVVDIARMGEKLT